MIIRVGEDLSIPTHQTKGSQYGQTTVSVWKPVDHSTFIADHAHKLITEDEWRADCELRAKQIGDHSYRNDHLYMLLNGKLNQLKTCSAAHNAVQNQMLYNEIKYMRYSMTSKPFSYIDFRTAAAVQSEEACSNGATTSAATNCYFSASASWLNSTGSPVTITQLDLLDDVNTVSGSLLAEYTGTGLPQAVADGETMNVTWTHTWTQGANAYTNAGGDGPTGRMARAFNGAYSTGSLTQIGRSWLVDTGTYETNYANVTVYAGGGTTDATITFQGSHTQSSGAYSIDRVSTTLPTATTYNATGQIWRWEDLSGSPVAWASGETKIARIQSTWAVT